ncbi:MAG: hypothetical protein ACI4DY_08535 [Monoglobaceae bacterium]
MIYVCEKCGIVYKAEYQPTECESCGCTYIRRADEKEVIDIVGNILLNSDDAVLFKEDKKRR